MSESPQEGRPVPRWIIVLWILAAAFLVYYIARGLR
jgi:hypothetical protein